MRIALNAAKVRCQTTVDIYIQQLQKSQAKMDIFTNYKQQNYASFLQNKDSITWTLHHDEFEEERLNFSKISITLENARDKLRQEIDKLNKVR